MNDITDSLRDLMSQDFHFSYNHDSGGNVVAVVGVRVHHDVIDIVELFGEHDADAVRIPGSEQNILFPRSVLWRTSGTSAEVIDRTLALPDPEPVAKAVAGSTRGCWMPTRSGRSTWLVSSTPSIAS